VRDARYRPRIDAIEAVWGRWAEIGGNLPPDEWNIATRCPGWDVAALYAHVGLFPRALADPPAMPQGTAGDPVTAVDILRGFNAPGGVAHGMAEQVAGAAVSVAAELGGPALVGLFADDGPRAVEALRRREPSELVPWPATGRVTAGPRRCASS
jgi:hypothetical protein